MRETKLGFSWLVVWTMPRRNWGILGMALCPGLWMPFCLLILRWSMLKIALGLRRNLEIGEKWHYA